MPVDKFQSFIHEQVRQRALEFTDLAVDFKLGIYWPITAVAKAKEPVETLTGWVKLIASARSTCPPASSHSQNP